MKIPPHVITLVLGSLCLAANVTAASLDEVTPVALPPQLALMGLDGKTHDLADYRGKVVLLNFWASWCVPCIREMPGMQRLAEKFGDRSFDILAVNVAENKNSVEASRKRLKIDFTILLDPEKDTAHDWGLKVLPTSYLIDPAGQIRYQAVGPFDWETDMANSAVESLLPGQE